MVKRKESIITRRWELRVQSTGLYFHSARRMCPLTAFICPMLRIFMYRTTRVRSPGFFYNPQKETNTSGGYFISIFDVHVVEIWIPLWTWHTGCHCTKAQAAPLTSAHGACNKRALSLTIPSTARCAAMETFQSWKC